MIAMLTLQKCCKIPKPLSGLVSITITGALIVYHKVKWYTKPLFNTVLINKVVNSFRYPLN